MLHNLLPILLLSSSADVVAAFAFQLPSSVTRHSNSCARQQSVILQGSNDDETATKKKEGDDNNAMSFLRKVGRVGGAANMDFANAMGLDESPSGGSKSSFHEDGFKVRE